MKMMADQVVSFVSKLAAARGPNAVCEPLAAEGSGKIGRFTLLQVFPIARMRHENPLCSLFAIYVHLPKLNVAGSIPVSRVGSAPVMNCSGSLRLSINKLRLRPFFPGPWGSAPRMRSQRRHLGPELV